MKKTQTGFTLIELAIVLVIIGLLLGGVLKGQELINSAKVKNMARDFQNVQVYLYGYQDRFKVLPGDDHNASTHVGGTNPANGTLNGVIQGNWNTVTDADETCAIWQHIRLANLAPGSTAISCAANNTYQPRNADGGLIGVQSASTAIAELTGMTGAFIVCSDNILGRYASQVDSTLDDGVGNTGAVRVATAAAAQSTGVAAPVDNNRYMVCMSF
jgi:prepilin-type N-terminal cleavage/methylation domain-containing protein